MPRASLNLSLPLIPIILPAMLHFSLCCLALLWPVPLAFIYSYIVLLLLAIWASHDKESILSIIVYIYVLLFTVVTDIIILAYYWDTTFDVNSMGRFSAAMIIINMLLKPPSCLFTVFILYQRNGGFSLDFLKNQGRDAYNVIGGSVDVENPPEGASSNGSGGN